jgi:hypothetical protein
MMTSSGFCTRKLNSYIKVPPPASISNPQSKDIKAFICCAVNLGGIYIFLGPPEDNNIQVDDMPSMHMPFSISGLYRIAFQALVAAAQQLGLDEEKDIVDRLYNGFENLYVKLLRAHVCFVALKVMLLTYFI